MSTSTTEAAKSTSQNQATTQLQQISIDLYLVSEARLGSGLGIGTRVDNALARDREGRPVLRWYAVKALLRDAADELRKQLKRAGKSEDVSSLDSAVLCLLGREGSEQGRLIGRSWRFTHSTWGKEGMLLSSSSRKVNSRIALDKTLRTIEAVPAGATATSEIRFYGTGNERLHVEKWLRRITNIGGSKSRFSGRICMTNIAGSEKHVEFSPLQESSSGEGWRVRVLLKNLEPLLLVDGANSANLMNTRSEINGATIRAALLFELGRLINASSESSDLNVNADDILKGCEFGNGFISPQSTIDATSIEEQLVVDVIPCPLSLQIEKATEVVNASGTPWWVDLTSHSLAISDALHREADPGIKFKAIRDQRYLATVIADTFQLIKPVKDVLLRNRIPSQRLHRDHDSRSEEPDKPESGSALYSQEVLVEDQIFVAGIVCKSNDAASHLQRLLEACIDNDSWLRVGRGGSPVKVIGYASKSSEDSDGVPTTADSSEEGDPCLTLFLASDWIVRGADLCFHTSLTPEALLDAGLVDAKAAGNLVLDCYFSDTTQVSGFIGAIGKRRRAELAIRQGSVFRYNGKGVSELRKRLAAAEMSSVGERTDEGFGRFRIDLFDANSNFSHGHFPSAENTQIANVDTDTGPEAAAKEAIRFVNLTPGLQNEKLPVTFPSKSQWETLLRRVLSGGTVLTHLNSLLAHSEKQAGAAWKYLYHQEPSSDLITEIRRVTINEETNIAMETAPQFIVALCRLMIGVIESKKVEIN